jgi:hypothetical protein
MADWIHFSITVTNHPKYSNHFLLIKTKLLPFIVEKDLTFWITNYGSQDDDSIAFRIVNVPEKIELTERFLDDLKAKEEIFNWQKSEWAPWLMPRQELKTCRLIIKLDLTPSLREL